MPETITSYTTFSAGTKARSAQINGNFSNHRGTLLPIDPNTAAAANTTYNLGSTEYAWDNTYTQDLKIRAGGTARHVAVHANTLTADYNVNFPAALPSTTSVMQIDASGNISFPGFGSSWNAQTFTAAGSWTCPANVTTAIIQGRGGSGGGAGGSSQGGGGGGGGCYFIARVVPVTAGTVYTITVGSAGSGGASGANGTDGGDSEFGSLVTYKGGAAGQIGGDASWFLVTGGTTITAGGFGGSGPVVGGYGGVVGGGQSGARSPYAAGGAGGAQGTGAGGGGGGAGGNGAGGAGGAGTSTGSAIAGSAGTDGGGGGGGGRGGGGAHGAGGAGTAGQVTVYWIG